MHAVMSANGEWKEKFRSFARSSSKTLEKRCHHAMRFHHEFKEKLVLRL